MAGNRTSRRRAAPASQGPLAQAPHAQAPQAPRQRRRLLVEEPDYELIPGGGRVGRVALPIVAGIVAVAVILVGATMFWWVRQIDPPGEPGDQLASVVVAEGSTTSDIAELLETKKVVTSATAFSYYARFRNAGDWRAGEYVRFRERMSMADAVDVLDAGPVPPEETAVTVIPGTRLVDALGAIAKSFPEVTVEELQAVLASGAVTSKYLPEGQTNWEGFLVADTYQFESGTTATEILQTFVDDFDAQLTELRYDSAESLTGHTAYELITIASMIEREAGDPPEEKAKIARVIFNRLDQDIALGIDATTLYGLGRTSGELTKSDLESDSPYNTRSRKGLPPTPISVSSAESLAAAINPADGDWIYYVLESNDPPRHFFTDSASEFEAAVDKARKDGVF